MRFVAISDTHNLQAHGPEIPDGDVLLHAGDMTGKGSILEIRKAATWLASLPHKHKVVIAGNHDFGFENQPTDAEAVMREHDLTYLRDSGTEIDGIRIWGSPWQPQFCDWAFNIREPEKLREKWDLIPDDTHILMTHGPPFGHGDLTERGPAVGCRELLAAIQRVKPDVHVFGHIHEGYGCTREGDTVCVNASICTLHYDPLNAPIVFDVTP
jgi:Icc-related predicted phosphoesterase